MIGHYLYNARNGSNGLFGEDGEDDPDDGLDPDKAEMIRNHRRYVKWEQTEAARAFMEEHLPPEKYQEYLRTRES